ncbi:hypothetical protein niasHT_013908 [Heterodera trifolii]|uniref:Uncharacterized protein n=1 Tax=Heterodera trifolii TaxID=157864 RepID=A0ABD2L1W2_9BILA
MHHDQRQHHQLQLSHQTYLFVGQQNAQTSNEKTTYVQHELLTVLVHLRDKCLVTGNSDSAYVTCAICSLVMGRLCRSDTRPNCTFARRSLVRVTDHIRRKEDHQGTIFGQYPNRPGQCLGVHVVRHPAPLPPTSEACMAIAKSTVDERYGLFNLFTEHDDDAWNGFFEAYVHAIRWCPSPATISSMTTMSPCNGRSKEIPDSRLLRRPTWTRHGDDRLTEISSTYGPDTTPSPGTS